MLWPRKVRPVQYIETELNRVPRSQYEECVPYCGCHRRGGEMLKTPRSYKDFNSGCYIEKSQEKVTASKGVLHGEKLRNKFKLKLQTCRIEKNLSCNGGANKNVLLPQIPGHRINESRLQFRTHGLRKVLLAVTHSSTYKLYPQDQSAL